jgi:homocysteine S-methyltransferase
MEALLQAGADLLAMETIPTIREAEVLVALLDEFAAVGWLSVQCRDATSTAAGEPIERVAALADGVTGLIAIGVNCTAPRHVPGLLVRLAGVTPDLPLIAYPNGGDRWDAAARRWVAADGTGAYDPETAAGWSGLGATWLGGCCGTGPAEIARLATAVAG